MKRTVAFRVCLKLLVLAAISAVTLFVGSTHSRSISCGTTYEECYNDCYVSSDIRTCQFTCELDRQSCEYAGEGGGDSGQIITPLYGGCNSTIAQSVYNGSYNRCMQGEATDFCSAGDSSCCQDYAAAVLSVRCR